MEELQSVICYRPLINMEDIISQILMQNNQEGGCVCFLILIVKNR